MSGFVLYPDPLLQQAAVSRPVDAALRDAGMALREAAAGVEAYGLAAAHIGRVEPVAVVSVAPAGMARDYRLLFNPVVLATSSEKAFGPEGSVSMPAIEVPIERAIWVEIGFDAEDGTAQRLRLEGFAARVAQHEIEQVNGIFFLSRLSRLKRDTAIRKYLKSQRAG
ncbi:peptide deformylase [Devosia beringensis]|uniref:peptide deformylase n=1 Tax=Devosia beringensis TaxID=2657486 RepID=UPI00186B92E9|nr:peptide deformylase [Devosia beringensis]